MVATNTTRMPRDVAESCERAAIDIIHKNGDGLHTRMLMFEIEQMDLVAAGLERACKIWHKFDPSRGIKPITFLYQSLERGMKDFVRKEESQDNRKRGLAWEMGAGEKPEKEDKNKPLADWLRGVFNVAKREYMDKYRQGRRLHETPQLVAIAALIEKKDLSYREAARLLASREDLRDVLKMKHLPSHNALWKARNLTNKVVTTTSDKNAEVVTENSSIQAEVVTGLKDFPAAA